MPKRKYKDETRPHQLRVRISDKEKTYIERKAKKEKLSASDWARRMIGLPTVRA